MGLAVWTDGDGVWAGRLEGWGKATSVVVVVVMVGVRMGTGASGPASDPIMLHDLAAVVRMASTNNTHLRNLWLSAPHGRGRPTLLGHFRGLNLLNLRLNLADL